MTYGIISILLIVFLIAGAILTKKCEPFLFGATIIGCVILYKAQFLSEFVYLLEGVVSDQTYLICVCGLFGSLIALLQASKGSFGFSRIISKYCNSERKTLLATFIMGILIFIDDYLNVLSIGACMKNVYDKNKLPRESLAYMLDSTGAPVCAIVPFSSWAAFLAAIFYSQDSVAALGFGNGIEAYIHAIPYSIYPIIALIIVFLFSLGVMPKLGGMKSAYRRVAETGKVYNDGSRKLNQSDRDGYEEDGNIWYFIIPMGILIAVTIVTSDLVVAIVAAILVAMVLYVSTKAMSFLEFFETLVKGFADMFPIITLIVAAVCFQQMTEVLGFTDFMIKLTQPILTPQILPVITFIFVCLITFTTANVWGMCAVASPVLLSMGASLGANPILIMAAIISGSAFGGHACFYSEVTVMSSQASGIENMDHALSQLPYVVIAGIVSIVGYLIMGFML